MPQMSSPRQPPSSQSPHRQSPSSRSLHQLYEQSRKSSRQSLTPYLASLGLCDSSGASTSAAAQPPAALDDRAFTASALRSLHADVQALRAVHEREVEEIRAAAEEENAQLRKWCNARIAETEDSRNVLFEQLSQEREGAIAAEVLSVKVAAERERLALRTALASAKARASAAAAESNRGKLVAREEAATHSLELTHAVRGAKHQRDTLVKANAHALAGATWRGEERAEQLRKEVASLTDALKTAQETATKADQRASKAHAANAKLREELKASEAKVASLQARLNSRSHAHGHAAGSVTRRPQTAPAPPTPKAKWAHAGRKMALAVRPNAQTQHASNQRHENELAWR